MRVRLNRRGSVIDITVQDVPAGVHVAQYLLGLTPHGLKDLAFVLAQDTAMASRCIAEHGEHTCSLAPEHTPDAGHICRACDYSWPVEQEAGHGTR